MGAALLLLAGAAAASTSVTVTVGPEGVRVEAQSDDVPRLPPRDENETQPPKQPPTRATFKMDARPDHQDTAAGENVTFEVTVWAARDVELRLNASNVTRGFSASFAQDRVWLANGSNATVTLLVGVPDADAKGAVTVVATATDTGERHEETVTVRVVAPRAANLSLAVDPANQTAQPGDVLNYTVYAKSTLNRTITLNLTHVPSGYRAYLSESTVHAGPDQVARVTLTVHVMSNATENGTIGIAGWTREGESAHAEARVVLHEVTTQPVGTTTNAPSAPAGSAHRLLPVFPMP